MKKLRIGVVGAGGNTRLRHLPGFQALDGVSVDVVCNSTEASSRSVAEAFSIPRVAKSWQEVVADPDIDAVCIGTWPYLHAPITIAALTAGKHVLTEARMAMDLEEAEAMVEASLNRPELVAQIVPSPFTLKWDVTIKRIIESGELGDLREIRFSKALGMNVDGDAPLNWRQDRSLSGNNTLMLGIYYEVVQRWLGIEPDRLLANGAIFTRERRCGKRGDLVEVKIPETIDVLAEYEGGLRLSCQMSGLQLGAGSDCYVIAGSKGTLRLDLNTGRLTRILLGGTEELVEPEQADIGAWNVEAEFVNSIRKGDPILLTNFEDGLAYMRFTDAAIRSLAEDSAWVSL